MVVTGGGAQGDPPYSGVMLGIHGTDEETYRGQRYLLGIAEGPAEIPPGACRCSLQFVCQRVKDVILARCERPGEGKPAHW